MQVRGTQVRATTGNLRTTWWEPVELQEVGGRLRVVVVQTLHHRVAEVQTLHRAVEEGRILRQEDLEAC